MTSASELLAQRRFNANATNTEDRIRDVTARRDQQIVTYSRIQGGTHYAKLSNGSEIAVGVLSNGAIAVGAEGIAVFQGGKWLGVWQTA
jgi:hypothetical protein